MDVGGTIGYLLSAMAGTGIGVVTAGLLAAGRNDDLSRRIVRLAFEEAQRREEVTRLRAELERIARAEPPQAAGVHKRPGRSAGVAISR